MDRAQPGCCPMTESQIFSRQARPNSVNKYFIIPPLLQLIVLEIFQKDLLNAPFYCALVVRARSHSAL